MTRAKDISKIITDADFSGTLDVTGTVTAGGLTVSGTGVVGTLTSSNNNTVLRVKGNGATNGGAIGSTSSDDLVLLSGLSERMRVTSTGRVGINDTAPTRMLMLKALGTADAEKATIMFENEVGTTGSIGQGDTNSNAMIFTENGSERMRIDANGNLLVGTTAGMTQGGGGPLQVYSNAGSQLILGKSTGAPSISFGSTTTQYGLIEGINGGGFTFYTGNGTVSNRLVIDSSGNVGIGVGNPSARLDLVGPSSTPLVLEINSANSNCDVTMQSANTSSATRLRNGTNDLQLHTNGTERLRIDSSGNVGIGKSAPLSKLDVTGGFITVSKDANSAGRIGASEYITGSTANDLVIQATGSGATKFYQVGVNSVNIDSSGRVMIGTSTEGDGTADDLTVATTGHTGITIRSGTTHEGSLFYSDGTSGADEYRGFVQYLHSANTLRFGTNAVERMRIHNNGLISVGNTSADAMINITNNYPYTAVRTNSNTAVAHWAIEFHNSNGKVGDIQTLGSGTTYNSPSDHRLKENVTADWDATTRLKQLNPVRFNFIADTETTVDGFLAHEVQSVVPEAITGTHNEVDDNGNAVYQGIDQSKLVPLLVKTIQELEARITALEGA